MSDSTTAHGPVLGCDVSQDAVVVYDPRTGQHRSLVNEAGALAAFVAELPRDALLVCEATGGHETALLEAALDAGVPAHRADARKVKAFVRSLGRLAKTDRIDAEGLTRYGQERRDRLPLWQAPDPALQSLQALVRLRRQLVEQRLGHRQRLKAPGGARLRAHLEPLVAQLDQAITRVESDIETLVRQSPALRQRVEIVTAIKGCGPVAATALVALLPELGHVNRKAIASLAGLAPHPRQSGRVDRYRPIRGGRTEVRPIVFMAALAASRTNPELKAFYERLLAHGKRKIVALTAVMRKLITIINARMRDAIRQEAPRLS